MLFKKNLVLIFLILLLAPLCQQTFHIFSSKPLTGAIDPVKEIEFNKKNWFDATFQTSFERILERKTGFREDLVRLYNQIEYSFFGKLNNNLVLGKNNQIFDTGYLKSITGLDYVGIDPIKSKIEKLVYVKNQLKKLNIDLIVVIVPSKAGFYKELIPDYYKKQDKKITNYETCIQLLKNTDINVIDFKKYFLSIKDTSRYLLFPVQGTHWSVYGATIAADSIANYIAALRKISLNKVKWDSINISYDTKGDDYDLGNLSNLIFKLPHPKMAYPVLSFENDSAHSRPRVLTIGDSFYWNIYHSGIPHYVFNQTYFWYYFHDIHADSIPDHYEHPPIVDDKTALPNVEKNDVVIILQNESNLFHLGFYFPENGFDFYKNKPRNIEDFITDIKNNPEMMKLMKEKSIEKNIPLEQVIWEDAKWLQDDYQRNLK